MDFQRALNAQLPHGDLPRERQRSVYTRLSKAVALRKLNAQRSCHFALAICWTRGKKSGWSGHFVSSRALEKANNPENDFVNLNKPHQHY